MKTQGKFRYFIDEKEVLYKDLQTMVRLDMTVNIDGLNIYYSSPKKVKDRLLLAEEFKKKAIDEMYFKNHNFKKEQVSQACYTNSDEVKGLIRERLEQENSLKKGKEITDKLIKKGNRNIGSLMTETLKILIEEDLKTAEKENKTEEMNRLVEEELERQEQQDWDSRIDNIIGAFTEAEKRGGTIRRKPSLTVGIEEITKIMTEGKKENSGKTDYSEIDFDILDLMANRFNANKHKYPHGNMLKPIEEKELLFALFRHLKKMIQPIDNDPETFEEHLSAIFCNAQMVYQQRKLKNN